MRRLKFFLAAWIASSLTHRHTQHRVYVCTHSPKSLCVKLAQELVLTSLKLCLTVPRVFLQALLLVDDDVLYVLHGQVVAERVEQDVLQLLQGDSLHVKLQEEGDERKRFFKKRQLYLHANCGHLCRMNELNQHQLFTHSRTITHQVFAANSLK